MCLFWQRQWLRDKVTGGSVGVGHFLVVLCCESASLEANILVGVLEQPFRSVWDQWQCQLLALQYITYPHLRICDHQSAIADRTLLQRYSRYWSDSWYIYFCERAAAYLGQLHGMDG
jgi:hypothetical protein